ncbi:MAG: hypothetical protein D4R64_11905 [Porphyromonadaceae bacterium]|nr:MAG: hypothetical protein D4R64_11905 [Porphyromonadaceae bacterium]
MLANVVAQEKTFSFTWLNRSEKKMEGNITVNLLQQPGDGLYQLDFTVIWYDQDGKPIIENSQMPFLCLSKYDFDMLPAQQFRCTSFDQKKPFNLFFQSSGKLNLQILNTYEGAVKLIARFQYALTRKLYESGRSELIDLNGTNDLKMDFQVNYRKPSVETEIAADNKRKIKDAINNLAAMRNVADNYQKLQLKVKGFEEGKSIGELNRPNFLQDLEALSANIINERALLNPDSLPSDTFQLYQELYKHLNDAVFDLRSAYLKSQLSQSNLADGSDFLTRLRKNDSLRNLIRIRIEPVVQNQVDSLNLITKDQNSIALEISTLIADAKDHHLDGPRVDSLILSHGLIKKVFLNLSLAHENIWNNYRIDINVLEPVSEIVNLHATFLKGQNDLQSAIDQVDNDVAAIVTDQLETPWYMSNRFLWTGLLAVLILVFASAIWSATRNKQILKERLTFMERGNSRSPQGKSPVNGIFSDELPNVYFTFNYEVTIPESVVGKIHYHTSSIKSVYHLVHGALLERKGGDFGGYLFGNQYKLPGTVKSEIFIEKACDSHYLRSSITNDNSARADLIDELDELVRENKKYRLIGWFTSSADSSMEIPEGLMKIHRSFFKEKWQIGILLNPGSDFLQGAGFLRRKTGYLDPMPDPAAFVKWDELYRFALNPTSSIKNDPEGIYKKDKDYSRIALNNTWGDSVVTAVNFDLSVAGEITAAAAHQAIPKDTFQVVGYLYGTAVVQPIAEGKTNEYEVFVDRFIELSNELTPRDLPGLSLIGWWGQANVDVMNYLQNAVDYHEQSFREAYQISCLMNPSTGELRIFTRKHSLEMNNSTIETEEYSLKSLLSR